MSEAMDPPAEATVTLAMDRLKMLGAIAEVTVKKTAAAADDDEDDDEKRGGEDDDETMTRELLTPLGNILSQLPLDPATGRMLIMGVVTQCLDPVLTAAACMSSRDPFIVPTAGAAQSRNSVDPSEIERRQVSKS